MKKTAVIITVMAISLYGCAQTPPKTVSDNFQSRFASSGKVKWDQEEENEWEAEFMMDGNEMSASFDKAGTWLETEKEIENIELPAAVAKAVSDNYPDYKTDEITEIETPDFKGYEIGLEKGEEIFEILIAPDGTIAKVKELDEDEDED